MHAFGYVIFEGTFALFCCCCHRLDNALYSVQPKLTFFLLMTPRPPVPRSSPRLTVPNWLGQLIFILDNIIIQLMLILPKWWMRDNMNNGPIIWKWYILNDTIIFEIGWIIPLLFFCVIRSCTYTYIVFVFMLLLNVRFERRISTLHVCVIRNLTLFHTMQSAWSFGDNLIINLERFLQSLEFFPLSHVSYFRSRSVHYNNQFNIHIIPIRITYM